MEKLNRIFSFLNLFTITLVALFICNSVYSAEIKESTLPKHIILEGEIEKGDYERLLNKILEKGMYFQTIYLASTGGDATEAIKIGRLIRSLNYSTEVGTRINEKNFCGKNIKSENCICASACPLIYLGGVKRDGDALAVHRVFLNHESLKNLSLEASKSLSKYLDAATENYLTEMGAPSSLVEKISSAASDRIIFLDNEYVKNNLTGYIKGYDEAMIAKCGSSKLAFKELLREKGDDKEFLKFSNILDCQRTELRDEVERKYFDAINAAIAQAEDKYIPNNSTLQFLRGTTISDIADLLGKSADDGLKLLALFGVGADYEGVKFKFNDKIIIFNGSITILFDTRSIIRSIDLSFYKTGKKGSYPYKGKYIGDLTSKSTPNDFLKTIGNPIKSGCIESTGVCMLWFDSQKFSANVGFETDRKTPRFISINKPGYFSKILNNNKDKIPQ